jgi:tRNA dimethylallyltransferase
LPEKEYRSPLLVVLGPTGAGKSELGLVLAERFGGEIVNCDSVQVYRGLDVGSAKVPTSGRRGVPHHLIDIAAPEEDVTAGQYSRHARWALGEIRDHGHIPVVVGGTGLYLRALLDGLSPAPQRHEELRRRLQKTALRRPRVLHRFLRRYDRDAASRIHENDHQKLIRAVELTLVGRQPATVIQSMPRTPLEGFRVLKIGLSPERKALYRQIDTRTARMFEDGLTEETQSLLDAGVSPHAKALQSLGYRQAQGVLAGSMTKDAAVTECQTKTRQYAKRQMTWFRREPDVQWLDGFGNDEVVKSVAIVMTEAFLRDGKTA